MASAPHFDLPFRLNGPSFRTVEQDTYEDVTNCVEAIVRTPSGFRDDLPQFGVNELLFLKQPIGRELILDAVALQEPRADLIVQESPDAFDELIDNIRIEVLPAGGGS